MEEELKECELLDIAEHLEPDILLRLAIKLSFSTAEYLRMKESHQSELAFIILYKWPPQPVYKVAHNTHPKHDHS